MILLMFNLHLSRQLNTIAETYYELEPEPEPEPKTEQEMEPVERTLSSSKASTNLAFNESQELKDIDDYLDKVREHNNNYPKTNASNQNTDYTQNNLSTENLSSYNEINDLLSKKTKTEKNEDSQVANKKSTMSYSLVDRTHEFLPTPVYLCQDSGVIIVNIEVNQIGEVIEASLNGASTSSNECLIDHAMEYAKQARFSPSSKTRQIGTITFSFIGKD